jgi:hypothetical protein
MTAWMPLLNYLVVYSVNLTYLLPNEGGIHAVIGLVVENWESNRIPV